MPNLNRQRCFAALASFALLLQLLAPNLAMASGAAPSLLCNQTGQISAEMQAGLDELKTALGIDDEETEASMDCDDCVASVYFIPTLSMQTAAQINWVDAQNCLRSHSVSIAHPRGPPLGSRAPPFQSVI